MIVRKSLGDRAFGRKRRVPTIQPFIPRPVSNGSMMAFQAQPFQPQPVSVSAPGGSSGVRTFDTRPTLEPLRGSKNINPFTPVSKPPKSTGFATANAQAPDASFDTGPNLFTAGFGTNAGKGPNVLIFVLLAAGLAFLALRKRR